MLDVPGVAKRVYKSVFVAPVSGPGSLNKFELQRRAMQLVTEAGANSEVTLKQCDAVNLSPTFKQQATLWIDEIQRRKRKPVKPGTVVSWKSALQFINQQIGDAPLSAVNNKLIRDHVVAPGVECFAPKTLLNYLGVVKMVVASAVDDDGEEVYPVKWKHDFMDIPEVGEQHTPSFTSDEVNALLGASTGQHAILFALLAGTGLRIGEALALRVEDVGDRVIRVAHGLSSVTGELQSPKTKNGVREVDLHPTLAAVLCSQIECNRSQNEYNRSQNEYIFHHDGTPLCQRVLLDALHATLKATGAAPRGFHAFRRYRNTFLRKARVPDGLIQFWMGHARASMTDTYDKVRDDLEFRRFTAEQVGLGFECPEVRKPVRSDVELHPVHPEVSAVSR
jgi:integrase